MIKTTARFLFFLALVVAASFAHASDSPLVLAHHLTGFNPQASATTVDYTLHVHNSGDTAVTEISLSLVPVIPVLGKGTTLNIAYLGPNEVTDVTLQVESRLMVDKPRYAGATLFWTGRCVDSNGKVVEFPVKSRPGGAE
ncbi:hypothetical protein LPW11_03425 [Geomonas sp. RF6]|uniref:hypothetical protein n=1 Tax=Geomonas sp. RF6 TaxID=2897342 RepID=UPI001E34ABF3|nr:hypothetical protein [Geomonas sp. RF6]UFS71250.1 hypothetical protein LPW11_03425 [Geomonas sp. RF6]